MDITYFIEQYFMSKRFILLLVLIAAGLYNPQVITPEMLKLGLLFYFASHVVSDTGGDVPTPTK